jgi:hypothetical protein
MSDTFFYTCVSQININGVWININGTATKATKDMHGRYVIRAYKNSETPANQLQANGNVNDVRVHATRGTNSADWVNSPAVFTNNYVSGSYALVEFLAEFKASSSIGSFSASILVERYDGTNWIPVPLKVGGAVPATVNFTAGGVIPDFPKTKPDGSGQVTDLYTAVGGNFTTGNLKWDASSAPGGEWVLAVETPVNGNPKAFNISYVTFSPDGKKKTTTPLGSQKGKTGSAWTAAQKRLLQAVQDTGTTSTTTTTDPNIPTASNSDISANPPNHIWTRRPSLDELMTANDSQYYVPNPATAAQILQTNTAAYSNVTTTHPLGYIIQDVTTAQNLNIKTGKGKNQVYQFNFTYNPTTISYTTSANTPIDWTLGTADPSNVLGGPTIVSFDLYLNRIQDLQLLKLGYKAGAYPGKGLTDIDQKGLLNRGTEYDLEWLYRVVNGTPNKTGLLTYGGETSDYGYITGTPFWLQFHSNMRYYGGLAGLSVNHVMFTKDMIPTLSVVSLTFNRYPVFDQSSAKSTGWILQKEKEYLKSTTTTPGATA